MKESNHCTFQDGIQFLDLILYLGDVSYKCAMYLPISFSLTHAYKRMVKLGAFLLVSHTDITTVSVLSLKKVISKIASALPLSNVNNL